MRKVNHCVKSVQMWSFFWSVFSRIRLNTKRYRVKISVFGPFHEIRSISPYAGKYGPGKTPYLDTFTWYGVSLRIQSECGKIRTKKTPYLDTFHVVNILHKDRFRYAARGKTKQKLRFQNRTKQKHFEPESLLKNKNTPQLAFTCSKVTIEILEQGMTYVQS